MLSMSVTMVSDRRMNFMISISDIYSMRTAIYHILSLIVSIESMLFCANVCMDLMATPGRMHPLSSTCLLWIISVKACLQDSSQLGPMWLQSIILCTQPLTCREHVICAPVIRREMKSMCC